MFNNRDTLHHVTGQIWFTKPAGLKDQAQSINVCFENEDGSFTALSQLSLKPDGTYWAKKSLGTLEDQTLLDYLNKLTGTQTASELQMPEVENVGELHDAVCNLYEAYGSLKRVAKSAKLSERTVRKILITKKKIAPPRSLEIKKMLDDGCSMEQIQEQLQMSRDTIQSYIPYD